MLFCALLSFVSGLLTFRYPLTFLFLPLLIYKYWEERKGLILILSLYFFGFIMMLSLHLCAKLPFFAQLGIVIKTSANAYIIYTLQGRFYLESKAHNYAIGDLLFVSGNRIPYFFAHIEGDFDYARYLQNQGIFSALKVSEVKVMLPSLFRYLTFNVADIVTYPRHLEPLKNVLLVKSIDYDDAFLKVIRDDDLLFLITMRDRKSVV